LGQKARYGLGLAVSGDWLQEWRVQLVRWILVVAHVLAGAAWFGAILYSLVVLHPRARSFFSSAEKFEEFITFLAARARWKVLGGAAFIALTGIGLLLLPTQESRPASFYECVDVKAVLFVIAVGLFCFTSWVLWPARVLASAEEVPKFQRIFRVVAITLLILVGASMAIGVVGSEFR
jgi:cytochrome bd-type quinol oxidase subunit 2